MNPNRTKPLSQEAAVHGSVQADPLPIAICGKICLVSKFTWLDPNKKKRERNHSSSTAKEFSKLCNEKPTILRTLCSLTLEIMVN